jgi:CRISPR/Cas system CSM-associated protein Csm2 small subunit
MFESWTDVTAAVGTAAVVAYLFYEIARRQKKLRDLINVLDDQDRQLTEELEELVRIGRLRPMARPM